MVVFRELNQIARMVISIFLVAIKRLYKSVCLPIRPSVRPYVMLLVTLLLFGLLGAT